HATQYPVLSRIARDYLSIQGSSVSSERAFSSGGRTGTKLRNQLTPETFEA
ncbi:HAT dimerization, partial [Wolfiporia cocos MD-104 SS10]